MSDWGKIDLKAVTITYDKKNPICSSACDYFSVYIIGLVIDVDRPEMGGTAICKELEGALRGGWQSFYDRLKPLSGSFVVIADVNSETYIVLDAVGTVPAVYNTGEAPTLVSSHPYIVAEAIGAPVSQTAEFWSAHPDVNQGGAYMPGLLSEFDGVEIITPNQIFSMSSKRMMRFYPDRDLPELSPKDLAEQIAPLLTRQLVHIAGKQPVHLSLSGGMDTRLTLAASKPISRDAKYFTYYTAEGILARDREISEKLAERLGLQHQSFPSSTKVHPSIKSLMEKYEGCMRRSSTEYQIASNTETTLHIRSNTLEIARGFYLKNPANLANKFTPHKLSRLFRRVVAQEFEPFFADFITKTSFESGRFYNFHYSDLFYWEHRLGAHYGAIYRAGRPYFETYMIYNCRKILELFLSCSLENRRTAAVIWELYDMLWPEVLETEIFSGSKFVTRPGTEPALPATAQP